MGNKVQKGNSKRETIAVENSSSSTDGFLVWCRHSGEEEIEVIPSYLHPDHNDMKRVKDYKDINTNIGSNYITHMYLELLDVMPPLNMACPQLTHLKITGIHRRHSLGCVKSLHQLQVLDISPNDFSKGIPAEVSKLPFLRELMLRSCRLTNLPKSIKSLHQLQVLDIWDNNFSNGIPGVVSDLVSLRVLRLSKCQIKDLPQSLKSLQHLQELNIWTNDFSEGLPDVISELSELRRLKLGSCQLKDLPKSMKSLKNLQLLNLWDNDFSEGVPEVIWELSSLQDLRLSDCKLNNLPTSTKFLSQLKALDLQLDDFSNGLPVVVSELSSLTDLDLSLTELIDLPQSIKSLQRLKVLKLWGNDFFKGLPDELSELSSLRELQLNQCKLTDLPESFHRLSNLVELDISSNNFTTLPTVIYQLPNLGKLDIHYNMQLHTINTDILLMSNLEHILCDNCESLVTPPYAVCQQGLSAIKKYFEDLRNEAGTELAVVPVAVVGNVMAGKTSLIRSLKVGKRDLTFREVNSPLDETTQVFSMESLQLTNSLIKLIDFGGHDVYHMAYQFTLKQQCVPFIVVNLEEYDELLSDRGAREATRRLCIDWMSHLYLACPRLGAPVLILTHRDKLSDEQFERTKHQLLTSAEILRRELLEEEKECSESGSEFCKILHLSDLSRPLLHPDDIFVFGKNSAVSADIQSLKECLEKRSEEFKMVIPRLWERVSLYIDEETSKPFLLLSDVKTKFHSDKQIEVILRYLHNSGKVLWFENKPTLAKYIFHQIPEITKMITLLFHHSGDERWEDKIANVTGFRYKNQFVEKQLFEQLVNQFRVDGVLNEAVLIYLMKAETTFPKEIAIELLNSFHILHGPIKQEIGSGYIAPYFASKYMEREWLSDGDIQLRLDILFNGLPLPKYVYQLMTVVALNYQFDFTQSVQVASNGVTILHGESSTHLVHDFINSKVTLQISTPVKLIGPSWQRLVKLTQYIVNRTIGVWKAVRPVFRFYCSHCLYMGIDNPDTKINPNWFQCPHQHVPDDDLPSITTFSGIEPVACAHDQHKTNRRLTVPKPLKFPCYLLTEDEISKLEKYLSELKESCTPAISEIKSADTSTAASEDESEDDADSVCSDIVEAGYADFTNHQLEFSIGNLVDLKPTSRKKVKSLFHHTNEVYQMSNPVRGRVMIINNQLFSNGRKLVDNREGSEIDSDNLSRLFTDMDFLIVNEDPMTDLSKEEIFSEIRQETQLSDHHALGMFVLVILSHGTRGGIFLDRDCQPVDLVEVKDLLSASKFPAMKGKPKIIIFHACSGSRVDFGDAVEPQEASSFTATTTILPTSKVPTTQTTTSATSPTTVPTTTPATTTSTSAASSSSVPLEVKPHIDFSKLTYLDVDDFYIMKPSTESYKAMRSKSHGTWFIRILVATFYKHSCHMDIEQLFKIVQARVRAASIAYSKEKGEANVGGNVPSSTDCTFTHLRKLYLFPKYSGK